MSEIAELKMNESILNLEMADGVNIAVRTWFNPREESQAIIVILHGMGGHGGYYKYLAERVLSYGLLIASPDLRGHGYSEERWGDLKMRDLLADVKQLLDHFKSVYPEKPIFLLGESMGGCVVINFLRDYANDSINLQGVILFSPGIGKWSDYMSLVPYVFVILFYLIVPGLPIIRLNDDGSEDDLRLKKYSARYIYELLKYGKKALSGSIKGMNIPVIIFHGTHDHLIKPETVKRFYDNIFNNSEELVIVQGGSHCLFNDNIFEDTIVSVKFLT